MGQDQEGKILAPGDLFIWATPNAGNPQKVQRYPGEWAAALRDMATLDAALMIPGHGLPVFGAERIRTALSDTAELLETIEMQVLALMNEGVTLDRVINMLGDALRDLFDPKLRGGPRAARETHPRTPRSARLPHHRVGRHAGDLALGRRAGRRWTRRHPHASLTESRIIQ